ncbi:MAG TPA: NAD-dependent epimerase/dehydratase family protein [Anaeromyxobacteraceae bacterium]|nr:NAD-dependent epimerase/dehydratase family protein [Anaeromyxobacteraceae bacterium]
MLAAVTGASGHLGANLIRALLQEGHAVRALVREDARALEGLPLERVRGDVLDPPSLRPLVAGADAAFHLAARISIAGDPDGSVRRTNVEGPRHVAEACLAARVRRLVHVSSIHAVAVRPGAPLDGSSPPADEDPDAPAYDRSKAQGERQVLLTAARGLEVVVLRPTAVLGPEDHKPSRMGRVLLALARGRMPGLVAGGFDWVDARDVSRAALAAARAGRAGGRYFLPGHWRSLSQVAAAVSAWSGRPPPRLAVPMGLARLAAPFAEAWARLAGADPLFTRESLHALRHGRGVRGDEAARDLHFAPRPFEETVRDALDWFRRRGWVDRG